MMMTATVVMAALTYLPYCAHHALRSSICSCSSRSKTAILVLAEKKWLARRHKPCRDFVRRQRRLFARLAQRLHRDAIGRGFVVTDDERKSCTARIGSLHLCFERAAAGIEHDSESGVAKRFGHAASQRAGSVSRVDDICERRPQCLRPGAAQEEHKPLDADREAARRCRLPPQL